MAAEEHRPQTALARWLREDSFLQLFAASNDLELGRVLDMALPLQAERVGFANVQSTLIELFSARHGHGKITCLIP